MALLERLRVVNNPECVQVFALDHEASERAPNIFRATPMVMAFQLGIMIRGARHIAGARNIAPVISFLPLIFDLKKQC